MGIICGWPLLLSILGLRVAGEFQVVEVHLMGKRS